MEKSRVTYQIEHNTSDYFFDFTVKTLHDGRVIFTDFANTIEEACKVIQDREKELESNVLEENGRDL